MDWISTGPDYRTPLESPQQFVDLYGAEFIDSAPATLDEVPDDKALLCCIISGPEYRCTPPNINGHVDEDDLHSYPRRVMAGYVWNDKQLGLCAGPPGGTRIDERPRLWMLMDRARADQLWLDGFGTDVPRQRAEWQAGNELDAEMATHSANLLPVARVSRTRMQFNAEMLLRYAAVLRGEHAHEPGPCPRTCQLLDDPGVQRVAATDLEEIGRDLERWGRFDWVAVGAPPSGPLPPFPGRAATG